MPHPVSKELAVRSARTCLVLFSLVKRVLALELSRIDWAVPAQPIDAWGTPMDMGGSEKCP